MHNNIDQEEQSYQREEIINNTSLTINKLDNVFEHNENQIDLMEDFIKSKTSEIAKLQEYLIGQFQNIENSKARNKKIEKILVTQAIPMLQQITKSLQTFRDLLAPFSSVATAYFSNLAIKAQELLLEKQKIIDDQAKTIKQLNQTLLQFNQGNKSLEKAKMKNHQQKKESTHNILKDKYLYQESSNDKLVERKQVTPTRQKIMKQPYQRDSSKDVSKSPKKTNKYAEYYQNIIDQKKIINYRCERPLSPLQTNIDQSRKLDKSKQEGGIGCERKQCIKQKIEKIKIRTQCKEKKSQFIFYDKNY